MANHCYQFIIEHALAAKCFDDIYVDTNKEELINNNPFAAQGVKIIERKPELAQNTANGNDLLCFYTDMFPDYDYYFQLFVTAPFLQTSSIKACVDKLVNSEVYDSCFTALENHGFYWLNGNPINYRPCILPRSQDMLPVIEETTGLYGMAHDALFKYRCRIGRNPYIHIVDKFEAVDINTEEDLKLEYIGKSYWGY
jgi:N-acylneuraminate cytidylyltransferase